MVMRNNNKGYMLIEIVMAAAVAIGIAAFIIALVIKLKNKNDDAVVDTLTTTDTTIVTNKVMDFAISEKENFDCSQLVLDDKTLKYKEETLNVFNDYVSLDEVKCTNKNGEISVFIPVSVPQLAEEDYDINVNYKYIVGNLTYPYIKVEADNPTEYSKSKKANIIIGYENGLLGGTYRIKYKWSNQKISCNNIDEKNYVDIKVNDKDKEVSLNENQLIEVSGYTGKGRIYACNMTPIYDYEKTNVLPETIVSGEAYLDNTLPTCGITNNGSKVYFSEKKDADSGILEYGISTTSGTPTYDKSTEDDNDKRLGFAYSTTFYGYVKDKAGNENSCSNSWARPAPSGGGGGGGSSGGCVSYCCQTYYISNFSGCLAYCCY